MDSHFSYFVECCVCFVAVLGWFCCNETNLSEILLSLSRKEETLSFCPVTIRQDRSNPGRYRQPNIRGFPKGTAEMIVLVSVKFDDSDVRFKRFAQLAINAGHLASDVALYRYDRGTVLRSEIYAQKLYISTSFLIFK